MQPRRKSSWNTLHGCCHRTCEESSLEETKRCAIACPQHLLDRTFVHVERDPSHPAAGRFAQLRPGCKKEYLSGTADIRGFDHRDDRPTGHGRAFGWMAIALRTPASIGCDRDIIRLCF